eukprot:7079620-Pyramimonas_sp.AAC.1
MRLVVDAKRPRAFNEKKLDYPVPPGAFGCPPSSCCRPTLEHRRACAWSTSKKEIRCGDLSRLLRPKKDADVTPLAYATRKIRTSHRPKYSKPSQPSSHIPIASSSGW